MKFDDVCGYAVIPKGPDGQPRGGVFWCPTFEQAEAAYLEECSRDGAYQPVLMYRDSETAKHAR